MSPFFLDLRRFFFPTLRTLGGDEEDRTPDPPACKAGALPAELHPHF